MRFDLNSLKISKTIISFRRGPQIREKYPDVFNTLASFDVAFQDEAPGDAEAARKFLRRRLAPTFELNKHGEVWRINYNNECRDSAMKKFEGLEQVGERS